jgi:NAD(P)-dependent dehydrogenase (short-subunit alcohol dehydrogenase family)
MDENRIDDDNHDGQRVWFITGAARGLGQSIARAALDQGNCVVVTARDESRAAEALGSGDRVLPLSLDVTDQGQIDVAVAAAIERFGGIDVLVNNAGFGLLGGIEEVSPEEVERVYRTNVFGLLAVTRTVLPHFRARRRGWVVNISSVGGVTASPGWGLYNSTKFAVEGISEALAAEVAPLGIKVLIVQPGYLRTDFLGGSLLTANRSIDDYGATVGSMRVAAGEKRGSEPGDPDRAAEAIVAAIDSPNPPLRLLLGADAVDRVLRKLDVTRSDLEMWREVSLSIGFEHAGTGSGPGR